MKKKLRIRTILYYIFGPLVISFPLFLIVTGICLLTSGLDPLMYKAWSFLAGEQLRVPHPMEGLVLVGLLVAVPIHLWMTIAAFRGWLDPKPHDALDEAIIAEMQAGTFQHPTWEDKERMSEDEFTRRSLAFQEWRKLREKEGK